VSAASGCARVKDSRIPLLPNLPPNQKDQAIVALSSSFVEALTSPDPPIVEVLFQTRLQELEATYPKASKPDLTAEDTSKQQMRECFISLSAKHVSTVVGQVVAMQPLLRRPTASQQGKPN
jgi:hypothetical protein